MIAAVTSRLEDAMMDADNLVEEKYSKTGYVKAQWSLLLEER